MTVAAYPLGSVTSQAMDFCLGLQYQESSLYCGAGLRSNQKVIDSTHILHATIVAMIACSPIGWCSSSQSPAPDKISDVFSSPEACTAHFVCFYDN